MLELNVKKADLGDPRRVRLKIRRSPGQTNFLLECACLYIPAKFPIECFLFLLGKYVRAQIFTRVKEPLAFPIWNESEIGFSFTRETNNGDLIFTDDA